MNQTQNDSRQNYPMIAAVALIIIGAIFLLRNFDVVRLGRNWWALFMLIPIAYSLSSAWRRRRENAGKFTPEVRSSLIGAVTLTVVMAIFLFGLSWSAMWPVFLIIGGAAMIFGAWSS
jgi:LiaF transmembrane domain